MRKSLCALGLVGAFGALALADLPQIAYDRATRLADKTPGEVPSPHQGQQNLSLCGPQPCDYFEDFEGADFVCGAFILGQGAADGVFETWAASCSTNPAFGPASTTEGHVECVAPSFSGVQHIRLSQDLTRTTSAFGCVIDARVPSNIPAQTNTPVIGPTTVSCEVAITAIFGSDFTVQPQARWTGLLTTRVIFFYYGSVYILRDIGGLANVGNWDTTGGYQNLTQTLEPCGPLVCLGGLNDGLPCVCALECLGDGMGIADGECVGSIHFDYGGGIWTYDQRIYAGPNVDQYLVYSDNFGQSMDVDDVHIQRGKACPATCGNGLIEPGEDCEFPVAGGTACEQGDDAACPGKCQADCTCLVQNADPCDPYPLENDVTFNKRTHGGWFTFTASAPAYAVDSCGSEDYDSRLSIWTGDCTSLGLVIVNDDCSDYPGYGDNSDTLAPCYNGPTGALFPYNSCTCTATNKNQQYWIWDDRLNGNPVGNLINITLSKRESCDALWGDFGACCRGLTGTCEDDVASGDCDGQFDTFYLRKSCAADIIECTAVLGACCTDPIDGICTNGVRQDQCPAPGVWSPNTTCTASGCVPHFGACCDTNTGECTSGVLRVNCTGDGEVWSDGLLCSEVECESAAIPTVSEWGIVIMTLLLLAGAKVYFGRRQETLA